MTFPFDEPTGTDVVQKSQPRSENFLKKVMRWKNTQRGDNSHLKGLQPAHRTATLKAIESGDNLNKNIKKDFLSLENVEESMNAMKAYVDIGNFDFISKNAILDNSINVEDCLKVKNETKEHVKNAHKLLEESQATATLQPEEHSAKKGGILQGGGDASGASAGVHPEPSAGGLKLARLHNQARLSRLKQARHHEQHPPPAIVLPLPTPAPAPVARTAATQDMTFLTGLTVEEQEQAEEKQEQQEQHRILSATSPSRRAPDPLPASATVLSCDDVHTPPDKARAAPRSKQQQALARNHKLLATPLQCPLPRPHDPSQPAATLLSKFHHHGQSAPSLTVHDVHALASSVVQRQHMAARGRSSARRGSSSRGEEQQEEQEEVAERQLMWLMQVEAKNRAAKREKENRIIEEVRATSSRTNAFSELTAVICFICIAEDGAGCGRC